MTINPPSRSVRLDAQDEVDREPVAADRLQGQTVPVMAATDVAPAARFSAVRTVGV
jgi:hypothetical protein